MMPSWPATQAPSVAQPSTPASYAYPPNPAFIPVAVRQTFGAYAAPAHNPYGGYVPPPPVQPPMITASPVNGATPAPEQAKGKVDWPESVRNYVQRSFLPQNDEPSVSRADIEAKLKNTIGSAKENGSLYTIDWDNMPLPQAIVKAERDAELKHAMIASPARARDSLNPKKRKSSEFANDDHPWRTTNLRSSLEDRISFPSPEKRSTMDEPLPKSSKFQKEANKRKRRFESEYKSLRSPSPPPPSSGPIVGTCEILEKKYLRLTAPPVPAKVRPEHILRQTLDFLKKKWKKESNYSYICDQFKSMRQDLTVQHIKDDFTVSVYEIHARIALEKGDIGEYNQCQTQLRSLYALGLKGNPIEFKAYRILYFIHTANRTGLNDTLADLTTAEKEERAIKHALNVRSSLALGNYHKFFQLYLDTPNMGAYLMDMFVVRERLAALCNFCKAYKPDVKLRFITEELGFESDADAAQFIIDHQGQHLLEDRTEYIAFLTGKAGPLFESARSVAFRKVDIKGQI
ncbi:SAC3/GANP/Nin1/mts3/eIF-3 p25 family-domain-containing protein [Dactylonectria macrodidyma]|uniref:SAC3/GANP/Nin1/mts3/eIF-3 p25 family-domain-containing protein n=1 Tax=Dactylonectria macrodidyma TaxID=307937 RepID=A0A9P9EBG5_9HYPO|nr:SAC3/GANP/Nin1/mts3/eIF-3 p25 family-domain-containing protein [Dactylonectria macrodidyma]